MARGGFRQQLSLADFWHRAYLVEVHVQQASTVDLRTACKLSDSAGTLTSATLKLLNQYDLLDHYQYKTINSECSI